MSIATRPFHANHAPFLDTGHDDPLAQLLQPPPNESPDERALREKLQREASMISHAIDEDIQEARKAFERRKKAIKILLLGELFLHILLLPYPTLPYPAPTHSLPARRCGPLCYTTMDFSTRTLRR